MERGRLQRGFQRASLGYSVDGSHVSHEAGEAQGYANRGRIVLGGETQWPANLRGVSSPGKAVIAKQLIGQMNGEIRQNKQAGARGTGVIIFVDADASATRTSQIRGASRWPELTRGGSFAPPSEGSHTLISTLILLSKTCSTRASWDELAGLGKDVIVLARGCRMVAERTPTRPLLPTPAQLLGDAERYNQIHGPATNPLGARNTPSRIMRFC